MALDELLQSVYPFHLAVRAFCEGRPGKLWKTAGASGVLAGKLALMGILTENASLRASALDYLRGKGMASFFPGTSIYNTPWNALVYDLLYEDFSPEERSAFETNVLRAGLNPKVTGKTFNSNLQVANVKAMLAVGAVLEDEELIHQAFTDPDHGLTCQLEQGIFPGGSWNEGSVGYGMVVVYHHLLWMPILLRHSGIDLLADDCFHRKVSEMLDFMLGIHRPDWVFESVGDCGPESIFWGSELAYAHFRHPVYGNMVEQSRHPDYDGGGNREHRLLQSLLFGVEEVHTAPLPGGSRLWRKSGTAVLRSRGRAQYLDPADAHVLVNFRPFDFCHGQPDKLSIDFFAQGHPQLEHHGAALGGYAPRVHGGWFRRTAAHSALVVDGKDQHFEFCSPAGKKNRGTEGEVLDFAVFNRLSTLHIRHPLAYPDVDVSRRLILADDLLFDLVEAEGCREHTFDLCWNGPGRFEWSICYIPHTEPFHYDALGGEYLSDGERLVFNGDFVCDRKNGNWTDPGFPARDRHAGEPGHFMDQFIEKPGHTLLFSKGAPHTWYIRGRAPSGSAGTAGQRAFLAVRRRGNKACFATLLSPFLENYDVTLVDWAGGPTEFQGLRAHRSAAAAVTILLGGHPLFEQSTDASMLVLLHDEQGRPDYAVIRNASRWSSQGNPLFASQAPLASAEFDFHSKTISIEDDPRLVSHLPGGWKISTIKNCQESVGDDLNR
ncbi:MAG: heparinase II/III family protein [Planctomycetes bacterium]|nr:heparinase II/III family protein [Planctomycetota bacterium]